MADIDTFYAVTQSSSLYIVKQELDPVTQTPIVEKIMLKGESRVLTGTRLVGGSRVGITPLGIRMFNTDRYNHTAYGVSTRAWGGCTTPIIGLFGTEKEAVECLNSPNLAIWDQRWKDQTNNILRLIGPDHPIFRIEQELLQRVGLKRKEQ